MQLRAQDLLVALKICVIDPSARPLSELASSLGLSATEMLAATNRATIAGLLVTSAPLRRAGPGRPSKTVRPNRPAIIELVSHGVRYVFVPKRGAITRGVKTGAAAPPLNRFLEVPDPVPVWPDARGDTRGAAFEPLYRSVPTAAKNDSRLYELLALVDSIRAGGAREKELAVKLAVERIEQRWT